MNRRTFVKVAGAQGGLLLGAARAARALVPGTPGNPGKAPAYSRRAADIIVVGAGSFGGWTALNLQKAGAKVLLIDAWGPGNARSTSGDESRGVRSSYGDRAGDQGVLWARWARRGMQKWLEFDATWGKEMKIQHYFQCGDLMLRATDENFLKNCRTNWDKLGVKYDNLKADEVRYRWPQFFIDERKATTPGGTDTAAMEFFLYEPDAGAVRARRSCESVAAVFQALGGELRITRAWPTAASGGKMSTLQLSSGDLLSAGTFVFACGPWLRKVFPVLLGNRMRTPMGSTYYFGPPVGNYNYMVGNIPTFNYPGVTGWPQFPNDNSGFRIRGGGGAVGTDPDVSERYIPTEATQRIRQWTDEHFPELAKAPLLRTHSCHYEGSISRNFTIDQHPDAGNVWIVGTGNSEGFKFGPVIGEYAAGRIMGKDKEPELECNFRIPKDEYDATNTTGFGGPGGGQQGRAGQGQRGGGGGGRGGQGQRAGGGGGGGGGAAGGRGGAAGQQAGGRAGAAGRGAAADTTQGGRGRGRGQNQQQAMTPIRACGGGGDP